MKRKNKHHVALKKTVSAAWFRILLTKAKQVDKVQTELDKLKRIFLNGSISQMAIGLNKSIFS